MSGAPEGGSLLSRRGKARRHEHLPQHRRRDCACSRSHARDNSPLFAPVLMFSTIRTLQKHNPTAKTELLGIHLIYYTL